MVALAFLSHSEVEWREGQDRDYAPRLRRHNFAGDRLAAQCPDHGRGPNIASVEADAAPPAGSRRFAGVGVTGVAMSTATPSRALWPAVERRGPEDDASGPGAR